MKKLRKNEEGFVQLLVFLANPIVLVMIGLLIIGIAILVYAKNPGISFAGLGLLLAGIGGVVTWTGPKIGSISGLAGVILLALGFGLI